MIPWVTLDRAQIPNNGGEIRLIQRGDEFSIMLGTNPLMNSRLRGSEEALATLTIGRLQNPKSPHILIGGLGMGFTLRAALGVLGPQARVTVAELVPAVITWARGPMAVVFGASLSDPRVTLVEADVAGIIRAQPGAFDAILLDVDNGPEGLTHAANDRLYDLEGLAAARAALRPGGVLAVWSMGPDERFTRRLRQAGFQADETRVRANGKRGGSRHVIWLASRAGRGG